VRDELLGIPHKDQDFVVPNVGYDELREALAPHGRVENLEVAGQRVGLRLYPRDRSLRATAPAGIEFAPPRTERSTGPGRHDFEIVASPDVTLEQDMGRRDFTINAIAKRLATGELLDPFQGREDLERRVLRTVSPQSFREDPLRLVRGLRFVSQFGVEPDESTLRQMRDEAASIALVSGERIGGGLSADGMGELSKLLLGAEPARALRLMRDPGVLVELLPEFAPTLGYDQRSARQSLPLDEHIFAVVQAAADKDAPLRVRLAALLHDLGKAQQEEEHAELSAALAGGILRRLRYPSKLSREVLAIVRGHSFRVPEPDPVAARRFLAEHGDTRSFDLVAHKASDYAAKQVPPEDHEQLARFREQVEAQRGQPHRLADLAVDGADLLELGIPQGPAIGRTLDRLLMRVVDEPELNTRERLLELAQEAR
jgi:tRNA nucleotidyltransferase (CCA-adding enzyme)